jgi:hypothetical protein
MDLSVSIGFSGLPSNVRSLKSMVLWATAEQPQWLDNKERVNDT